MTDNIDFNIFCPLMKEFCNKQCPAYNKGYTIKQSFSDDIEIKPHCLTYCLMGD